MRGNRYLLVITDYLTKWAQSYPMAKADTTTTARHLMEWVYQMGPPCHLISDQGTNFLSAAMNDVYDILGIYKAQTTAWHPQCNGNTEQVNKTLCDMITKRFNMGRGDWDLLAPMCTYNYNIAVHSVTMMFPFFLKNSREA